LDLPRHLFHFGPATIQKISEAADLEIERIYYVVNLNNIFGSLAYVFEDILGKNLLSKFLRAYPLSPNLGFKILHWLLFPLGKILSIAKQSGRITIIGKSSGRLKT
jgi:hypothetical protein